MVSNAVVYKLPEFEDGPQGSLPTLWGYEMGARACLPVPQLQPLCTFGKVWTDDNAILYASAQPEHFN